ncbi:unnamed protein product, partial [Polarella glacialis]
MAEPSSSSRPPGLRTVLPPSSSSSSSQYGAAAQRYPIRVTVRRGDIFRRFTQIHFVKMNPFVEVFIGSQPAGTVPPASGADQEPTWNCSLPLQDFEIGEELQLKVWDKNIWPRKDVHIGTGFLRLSTDIMASCDRRTSEQTVKLFKKHEGEKPEHTGNIQVSLSFPAKSASGRLDDQLQ